MESYEDDVQDDEDDDENDNSEGFAHPLARSLMVNTPRVPRAEIVRCDKTNRTHREGEREQKNVSVPVPVRR